MSYLGSRYLPFQYTGIKGSCKSSAPAHRRLSAQSPFYLVQYRTTNLIAWLRGYSDSVLLMRKPVK